MKRFAILLLLTATPALAQAQAGSNMGLTTYPAPSCTRPVGVDATAKPAAPPDNLTELQAIAYNRKVDAYNAAMRANNEQANAFATCINAYIANGNADMQRIRAALDAAIASTR
jgi:hypothetical protein